jgi:hypothetical protein
MATGVVGMATGVVGMATGVVGMATEVVGMATGVVIIRVGLSHNWFIHRTFCHLQDWLDWEQCHGVCFLNSDFSVVDVN